MGWTSRGLKNYFIGVTRDNLYILRVSAFFKPKEMRKIPLTSLEPYSSSKGQGDVHLWMKLNIGLVFAPFILIFKRIFTGHD